VKPRLPYNSWVILGLLLVAAASFAMLVLGERGLLELYRLKAESEAIGRGNQELLECNQALSRRLEALQKDPAEVESLARERLGMIKEGEVVYYLPSKAAEGPAAGQQKPAPIR
jgi:cell division protein FtsB